MDIGQSQGWSRGRSGRLTPIQAFFWREGQTAHKHVSAGQTELKSVCLVWTDSLSYFQSAVLALPWIERLLARGRTILKELKLVKLTFCSPSSSFGSSEPLRAPPPFALGPSWVGGTVNRALRLVKFYLSKLRLCAKNRLDVKHI